MTNSQILVDIIFQQIIDMDLSIEELKKLPIQIYKQLEEDVKGLIEEIEGAK